MSIIKFIKFIHYNCILYTNLSSVSQIQNKVNKNPSNYTCHIYMNYIVNAKDFIKVFKVRHKTINWWPLHYLTLQSNLFLNGMVNDVMHLIPVGVRAYVFYIWCHHKRKMLFFIISGFGFVNASLMSTEKFSLYKVTK